jgi:hypothetical protein
MPLFDDRTLSGITNTFRKKMAERVSRQHQHSEALNTVEIVIDGTDNRIRLISGYRKKLLDSVKNALDFTDEMVARIPAAIEVSSQRFVSDPYVNAFFTNVDDLQTVFNTSSELRDFLGDHEQGKLPRCCCLLCMKKTEKSVFGMELSGDILKKDVQQTAVSFSDHRIYSPAPSETAARKGLKECLLGGLITHALESIMLDKVTNYQLQSDRQMLHARLRHLQYKARNAEEAFGPSTDLASEIEATRVEISAIEDRLIGFPPPTPQASLAHVNKLLQQPEKYIQFSNSTLTLDKMGVRIDDHRSQPSNRIGLTEVVIGEEQPRVVTLAEFPVQEVTSQKENQAHINFS